MQIAPLVDIEQNTGVRGRQQGQVRAVAGKQDTGALVPGQGLKPAEPFPSKTHRMAAPP